MITKRPSIAVPLVVALMVGACGSSADRSTSPSAASPEPSASTLTAASASSAAASPPPTTAAATVAPAPSRTPRPTTRPTPTPIAWTDNESVLLGSLRPDAGTNCTPRRSDLPPRSIAGIECRPPTSLVSRVGVYLFPTSDTMLQTYRERMDEYGVGYDTGNCYAAVPNDTSWAASVPPEDDESRPWARIGCYFDDNGNANIRVTCENSVYIGVLGATSDLRRLFDWALQADERVVPGFGVAPGICQTGFDTY